MFDDCNEMFFIIILNYICFTIIEFLKIVAQVPYHHFHQAF